MLTLIICFIIFKTRELVPSQSQWQPFSDRPIATTIFIGSSINAVTNIFPLRADLPEQWEALLHVLTLFAVVRLTKHLLTDKSKRKLLNQLTFFTGITMFLFLLGFQQVLILLYVFYVSIAAFLFYLLKLPATRGKALKDTWLQKIWGIFPAIVIISGLTGYDQLAIAVFSVLLTSIIACLIVWVLYRFHLGVLELTLSVLPIAINFIVMFQI